MTPDERKEYAAQYRRDGYGKNADARYRAKNLLRIRAKDRARKRAKRSRKE